MKKISYVCLSLMLTIALAVTVFAVGDVVFAISASEENLSVGEEFTLTASCTANAEATSYGLMLKFDEDVFEVVSGNVTVADTLVASTGTGSAHGFVFMFQEAVAYCGTVGTMEFKVKETAPAGTYTVTAAASAKNGTDTVESEGCSVTVTVGGIAVLESTASGEPNVGESIEPDAKPSVSKPIVEDVLAGTVPVTGDAPRPGTDMALTTGTEPKEKDGQENGFPAWIFLTAAGVIAVAGIVAFGSTKKKKS